MNSGDEKQKSMYNCGFLKRWMVIAVLLHLYDAVAIGFAYFYALFMRFDCMYNEIPVYYIDAWKKIMLWYIPACFLIFHFCRMYHSVWRYAGLDEMISIAIGSIMTCALHVSGSMLFAMRMPISYYMIGALLQFVFVGGIRFTYRIFMQERNVLRRRKTAENEGARVMLIGAGTAATMILNDLTKSTASKDTVCCIIDDNPNKWKRLMNGIPIVGGRETIAENAAKYNIDKIFFAIPSLGLEEKKKILEICNETGCMIQSLPSIDQLVNHEVSMKDMRDVNINDLLGRKPVRMCSEEVFQFLGCKTILVTGGGGSIGSELCRQIADHKPGQLIIFDIYENNAYEIQQELKRKLPELNLVTLIGSVRDSRRIGQVFEQYKPDVVFHAAAHKHVPLMEDSPNESIKNNVIGTYKTAYAALQSGCERFVLISTDKAVNPTNIMGASKRLCEMVIQTFDKAVKEGWADELPVLFEHSDDKDSFERVMNAVSDKGHTGTSSAQANSLGKTEFAAVRFGNVLGSNGSVLPLFRKQIAEGGPVTVTHPEMVRYFMTIPEAVSLVLQASLYARGGEIFVLDMGDPVKIDTLARNLIRLSGFKPDSDIKIEYIGLRPGEKLYEEKLMAEEGLIKTANDMIYIGKPIPLDSRGFLSKMEALMDASYENTSRIRELVAGMVPTYHPEKF